MKEKSKSASFKYEWASKSGRKIERAEITKFELAEEKDHIDITYVLASSVPNDNGALFTKEELEAEGTTIVNEPLIIVPSWEDGNPTGHSIEDFPKLGWDAKTIGTHIAAETFEENGITHLKTTVRVWKIRYPEIAQTMVNLHAVGDLKFSMETKYQSAEVNGTIRTLKGIKFIGSAVVDDPANPYSYSLEVAKRKKEEEKIVTFEQAMKLLKEHNADAYLKVSEEVATLTKSVTDLSGVEGTNKELTSTLETANKTIDTLKVQITAFEQAKKEAAEKEIATKRLTEMAQYVTYTDEEKEAKMATFASMNDEVYTLLLETAKKNKPATQGTETAGLTSDTSLNLNSGGFLDGIEKLD